MCFRCNRYGHSSTNCFAVPRCLRCAGSHLLNDCTKTKEDTALCCNCGGPHAAKSRSCPACRKEKERLSSLASANKAPAPARAFQPAPPPTKPAWRNPALQFIPPQISARHSTPKTRLAVDLPPTRSRKPPPDPEDFPQLTIPEPLTPETAAELKIPLRSRSRSRPAPADRHTTEDTTAPLLTMMMEMMKQLQQTMAQFQQLATTILNSVQDIRRNETAYRNFDHHLECWRRHHQENP